MDPANEGRPALAGIPPEVIGAQDYEALASAFLPPPTFAYIAGGSGRDLTPAQNRRAFEACNIVPRILRDVGDGHTRLSLAGTALAHPFLLAPLAYQQLAHPSAELATAQAAAATDSLMVCSTLSSRTLEDIATASNGRKWFQLYLQPRREDTLDLVRRAEAAGFEAIMLTLDAAIQYPSVSALRAGFRMPADCVAANLAGYPAPAASPVQGSRVFQGMMRNAPQWHDLDWLQRETSLPLWIKGVLHADDARELKARGVAGIVVSNHGGRSLDGAPASLQMLPAIRAAVGDDFPLLLDSGIRSGADAFKAIALGADAVMVGRLQAYALSVAGALGVAHMLKLLREELELSMAMAGCATLDSMTSDCLVTNLPSLPR